MDTSKSYLRRHRGAKRSVIFKCLIVALMVLAITWIGPSPSPSPSTAIYNNDPPAFLTPETSTTFPETSLYFTEAETSTSTNAEVSDAIADPEPAVEDSCKGRRVHMYDMPASFNRDLLKLCEGGLVKWIRFCKHYPNFGFGEAVYSTGELFSRDDWFRTDAYMLEVIFFDRMRTYPCLAPSPSTADIFFVPYFSGLAALPYLYNETLRHDKQGREAVSWLESEAAASWRRYQGRDHFMISGRTGWDFGTPEPPATWGTCLFDMAEMRNMSFMVLERRPWRTREHPIPYPVGFHPSSLASLNFWIERVRTSPRPALFSFSGALRPQISQNIRGILSQQCANATSDCSRLDCGKISCSHNPEPIYESLLRADFCLQPRGDTATRRSTIDSIVSGCIPVIFHPDTAQTQYMWHFPDDYSEFSVFISEACIMNGTCIVRDILRQIRPEDVLRMREKLISMIPSVVYKHPGAVDILERDAFDLTIEGMVKKVALLREEPRPLDPDSMRR